MKKQIQGTNFDLPDPSIWNFPTVRMLGKCPDGKQKMGEFSKTWLPSKNKLDWQFVGFICPHCESVWDEIKCNYCGFSLGE